MSSFANASYESSGSGSGSASRTSSMSTRCVWGADDKPFYEGNIVFPLCDSVTNADETYEQLKSRALYDPMAKPHGDVVHGYGRNTNSSTKHVRDKILAIEGLNPEYYTVTDTNCGMSAISCTLRALTSRGDRIVTIDHTYGGTSKLMLDILPREGRECVICPTDDVERIEREIAKGCRIVYIESPTNPTLKVVDIRRLARAAADVGAITVVDNTFASPINQSPIRLGANIVVYSATKYLNGMGNAMGGFVVGDCDLVRKVYDLKEIEGQGMSPDIAHKIDINLKTLALRVRQHNANAMAIAELCHRHPLVKAVYYPGLSSHPRHDIACRQMTSGFGGMLSFELNGGEKEMSMFLDRLRYKHLAASLGHVETLVGPPSATSHVECSREERERLGISETLIRYSTGIEDTQDVVADVKQALDYVEFQRMLDRVEEKFRRARQNISARNSNNQGNTGLVTDPWNQPNDVLVVQYDSSGNYVSDNLGR